MKPSRVAPGLGDVIMVRACPAHCFLQATSLLCRVLHLRPSRSLHPSNILPAFHPWKHAGPALYRTMGLSQRVKNSQHSVGWDVRGKVLQKVMNALLPHVPFNVCTVKGVEIVSALVQSWCGAENRKGEKLKLIIPFPSWKDNPEQAVRV